MQASCNQVMQAVGGPAARPARRGAWAALLAAALATVASCSRPEPPLPAGGPVHLELVDRQQFDEVLGRFKGKVVLVDLWATWCGPCVDRFPHNVELYERFRDRGFELVAVSFDEPSDEAAVRSFLGQHNARFTNLLSRHGTQASFDLFEPDFGGIPNYWLYDRQGKQVRRFSPADPERPLTPDSDDLERAIEELL